MFGVVLMMSAVGTGIGTVVAPPLRRRVREEWILAGSLVVPSVPLVFAARSYGRGALIAAATAVAAASACGRLAFDSLLQRDGADVARGRAFARFETRFQLLWVLGGRARRRLSRATAGGASSWSRSCCCSPGSRTSARSAGRSSGGGTRRRIRRPAKSDATRAARVERADAHRGASDHRRRAAGDARGRPARLRRRRRARPNGPTAGCAPSSIARGAPSTPATMVGCTRAYSFELTMPGGALVPVAAVSAVAVQPTHRRRGVLTADDGRAARRRPSARRDRRGAHRVGEHDLRALRVRARRPGGSAARSTAADGRFARPVADPGRVRMVARGEADAIYQRVYEDVRRARAGAVSRPDFWWPEVFWVTEPGHALFDAVHEDATVTPTATSRTRSRASGTAASPTGSLRCGTSRRRTTATRPRCGSTCSASTSSSRSPRPTCRPTSRCGSSSPTAASCAPTYLIDSVWVLPLDAAALLAARTYSASGKLVIEIVDPDGSVYAGRARRGSRRRPRCRAARSAAPDLSCSRANVGRACRSAGRRGRRSWPRRRGRRAHAGRDRARRRHVRNHAGARDRELVLAATGCSRARRAPPPAPRPPRRAGERDRARSVARRCHRRAARGRGGRRRCVAGSARPSTAVIATSAAAVEPLRVLLGRERQRPAYRSPCRGGAPGSR